MYKVQYVKLKLVTSVFIILATGAYATNFNIPSGDLATALDAYATQTGIELVVSESAIKGAHTKGARGELSAEDALAQLLRGTGFVVHREAGAVAVVPDHQRASDTFDITSMHMAAASAPTVTGAALETVTVTSSKIGGDVQNIPISITALSQEQLTSTQTAGGPDLVKQVPNMTFTKTNFSGYSIQLRGIGTQAISVTTDPAVAVAFNDIPFIRNHFFEQEFYDVSQVQVLRGPQGTLYGRNATAGVVNLTSAKPSDQFEAMASLDVGNYGNRRLEGMINIPIVDDRFDLRVAGEWTKRQGYSFDTLTDERIDGRDLWSSRVTLGWKPDEDAQVYLVWEHFSEDDNRMRTAKQLCKTDPGVSEVDGVPVLPPPDGIIPYDPELYLSQGCLPASLYSKDAFEVPNGLSLPYYEPLGQTGAPLRSEGQLFDPYAGTTQSTNLRVIESAINPQYRAKNDTLELNADYNIMPLLTLSSQTGYNRDFLWSTEDYNRFNTAPGAFLACGDNNYYCHLDETLPDPNPNAPPGSGVFCDPQLGCSDRLVAQDLSDEHAWQLSQEFRLASHFSGPLNFSAGANYLHYETEENYYVFINSLTLAAYSWSRGFGEAQQTLPWVPGVSDNANCLVGGFQNIDPNQPNSLATEGASNCQYIDPNPLSRLNNKGHNYFLSQNPYTLNSYAGFGEAYYNVTNDLKLTAGLRWTDDQKHFSDIPSELLLPGYGYPVTAVVNQSWERFTGRTVLDWTPRLDFTDQTLIYASYAHGYKAGGANPPGARLLEYHNAGNTPNPIHPLTFKPEYIEAFELGSKNTMFDGALTLNGDVFYYNYIGYQISRIVDRTSINDNFDAHVIGTELEATWEPAPGLRLNFAGGYEDARAAKGSSSIDLMDRTAGNPNWIVVKPFVTQASNCILPDYVVAGEMTAQYTNNNVYNLLGFACGRAYGSDTDPVTGLPYVQNPTQVKVNQVIPPGYPGFDPLSVDPNAPANVNNGLGLPPNDGEGFVKNLSGNQLPNAPPFTMSAGAQYTLPLTQDWAGTLRGDYYWQDYSWARIFNDNPYDRLRGYTTVNLTLIFTNQNGWQVMLYDKNVFNETAITGTFLNSDDSGLTTNVFLTDPKLIGVRVTKNW